MKISFTDKILESEHPVLIISDKMKKLESSIHNVNSEITKILKEFVKNNKNSGSTFKTLSYTKSGKIFYFTVAFCKTKIDSSSKLEFSGNLLSYLENQKIDSISVLFLEDKEFKIIDYIGDIVCGFYLKDYRFEKYKTISKKDFKISSLKLVSKISSIQKRDIERKISSLKGIFLTRDLVSEPANVLYPSKFVDYCTKLKKEGIQIEKFLMKKN